MADSIWKPLRTSGYVLAAAWVLFAGLFYLIRAFLAFYTANQTAIQNMLHSLFS